MESKRIHKKPIGQSGPVLVTHVAGHTNVEWQKVDYPPEKKAQELAIATSFVSALNAAESSEWTLTSLREDDFDFELMRANDRRYLELQEIVIPSKTRGSPYAKGEQVIRSYKFANTILSGITRKCVKYPPSPSQPLDLLVYNTHWRFLPNEVVLQLVGHSLTTRKHPFSRIYFFSCHDSLVKIFPDSDLLKGFHPSQVKGNRYVNFDPGSAVAVAEGDKVGVRFNLSPHADKMLREP